MIKKAPYYKHWLEQHFSSVNDYLYNWVEQYSRDQVRYEFEKDPFLGKCVVEDWILNKDTPEINQQKLLDYIRRDAVFVILLLGMPDSGKTTTAYKICEMLKDDYHIVHVAPLIDEGTLPDWIGWKSNPYKLEKGDLAIVDEASIQNNARDAMSRKNRDDLGFLAVGRHIGAKLLYLTQMSSIADLNLTRWSNAILSKGYSTAASSMTTIERAQIADNPILDYLTTADNYAGIPSTAKDWTICTHSGHTYMTYLPRPSFMNDKLSRSYMRYIERANGDQKLAEDMAMRDAQVMRDNEHDSNTIYTQMMARGFHRPRKWWQIFCGEIKPPKGDEQDDWR